MTVKITIGGEGLEYAKETDLQKAGQIIAFLNAEVSQHRTYSQYPDITPVDVLTGTTNDRQSPRQALLGSDAKTNTEKIVVLADFVCKRDGLDSFSPKEIQLGFKKAGEALPKNFTRDFFKSIQQGYVLETEEKGTYTLTDLGLDALRDGFSTHKTISSSASTTKKKGGKSRPQAAIVRNEVTNMEIVPSLEGMTGYWETSTKGMKILWLLAYADENNISDGLTSTEVSHLASKLKDQIKTKDFAALSTNSIKKGYMTSPSTNGMSKILQPGVDALKELK